VTINLPFLMAFGTTGNLSIINQSKTCPHGKPIFHNKNQTHTDNECLKKKQKPRWK